ncbi:AEC family transporter [Catenovulum sp. 2E275]|uniref:AEC family transporter n=1 Tax=Catenovulum sp. 2E275 TaxID=2980497 RepID=UPI0021D3C976|nr:AEC family transporter [Catenovulum sp. 2E275]MCU4674090.1 AEC family transporter [Catenovulum sp. 2E275]
MSLFDHLLVALNVTAPILIILLAGIGFKKINLIDDHFVSVGNKLVFNVALPCLLFLSTASGSFSQNLNTQLIGFAALATILSVVIVWLIAYYFVEKSKLGVFTQCAFRGNMAIIGLALCVNAYGEQIIAKAAVYLAFITVLYNLLAVLLLSNTKQGMLKKIAKNPLIIAIISGALWSSLNLPTPQIMGKSLGYLSQLTLPLALLCIGASLDWHSFKANHKQAASATAIKLIIQPLIIVTIGIYLGFDQQETGILFLMMATPTAAAAYVMSKQMTQHGNLAAEIITLSTALSPLTVTLGLVILSYLGFV